MSKTLLGLGSYAMDTVISCPALPTEDSFGLVSRESVLPGGSCTNVLATFAALGGHSRFFAKLGQDETARLIRDSLRQAQVDDSRLLVKANGVSMHTTILTTPDGRHCILVTPGDSLMALTAAEADESLLDGVELFYTDLFPCPPAIRLAEACRSRGVPVIACPECTPGFMRTLGNRQEDILHLLSLADLLIGGRESLCELAGGTDTRENMRCLYQRFRPALGVLCTAGTQGAYWWDGAELLQAAALPVQAVDSTGAGDSFLGALLYAYFSQGDSREQALAFAAAAGALKCTVYGPRLQVGPERIREFMAQRR